MVFIAMYLYSCKFEWGKEGRGNKKNKDFETLKTLDRRYLQTTGKRQKQIKSCD